MLIFKSNKPIDNSIAGLITVINWTIAPDGEKYLYFWAPRWQILTDADMPIERFRSSERWQMIAIARNADVLAVFPGCQVKAWIRCDEAPLNDCFAFHDR